MGNVVKQTLALAEQPSPENSPITETSFGAESPEDGVYSITTTTRYNAAGLPLISVQKRLISEPSPTLESKSVFVSERGLTSTQWTEYSAGTKRLQYSTAPGSAITAETVKADGVVLSQKDTTGITTAATRPPAIQKDSSWFSAPARLAKQGFRSQVYSRLGGWLLKLIFMCTPYVYANV